VLSTADGLSADTVLSANIALKTAMPIPWQELEQLASIAH
jgi:hypothetical protein